MRSLLIVVLMALWTPSTTLADGVLRLGVFDIDASPPIGSPLAYGITEGVETPLSCRGIVLAGAGDPIVLCSVDWIGIANGGQSEFREGLARAVRTTPQRVAVHTIHQHDAPTCDFAADAMLAEYGLSGTAFNTKHARDVIRRAGDAVAAALEHATPVTHVGMGAGSVEKVASNRRILGPDGTVLHTRWTATADPKIRAFPVGTIDPELKLISFWNDAEPVAALTYYATHPQSYYRTGLANPDFPGIARNARQEATGVPHIHFTGAAGNVGAGKWNDGAKENRQVLADRVAAGMKRAWQSTKKTPLRPEDVRWSFVSVSLPVSPHLDEASLKSTLENEEADVARRWQAAKALVWYHRCRNGDTIDVSCLTLAKARILHMPGELFVEYSLAARSLRNDLFVVMAAYGDYAPGYIGTAESYAQGGYEVGPHASRTAPTAEDVLMDSVGRLLDVK